MASLPPDAAEQVRVMKALERDVLAAIDRVVVGGGGGAPSTSGSQRRQGRDRWGDDPAHAARTGMARLRRELGELEAIVEEQARPADRSACLEALAERRESHDSIRQILRDATLRAADAEANAATSALSAEGDERDELLGDAANGRGGGARQTDGRGGRRGPRGRRHRGAPKGAAMMAEELDKGRRTLAAMAESRATMKRPGTSTPGIWAAALGAGGRLLKQLEIQAVRERLVLWGGSRAFVLAALHVVLKRTPLVGQVPPAVVDTQESRDEVKGGQGGGEARGEGRQGCEEERPNGQRVR